ANQNDVLVFSYIGMKSKEIVIGLSDIINVKLEDSAESLEEVVVIGYGTQKKAILTSSVSSIKGDELTKEPVTNASIARKSCGYSGNCLGCSWSIFNGYY
ncbi:MAG: hypothetical protein JJE44_07540, partial [Flavobacteriaceae bacterium]|nr:hypothetical protein [Flavobacteriaceae bacterium]